MATLIVFCIRLEEARAETNSGWLFYIPRAGFERFFIAHSDGRRSFSAVGNLASHRGGGGGWKKTEASTTCGGGQKIAASS
jgi:hypothetical protein